MNRQRPSKAAIRAAENQLLGQSNPLAISIKTVAYIAFWLAVANTAVLVYLLAK